MAVLYILIAIFTITPFLPATGNPHWFFRTADFVRLQSMGVQCVLGILLISLSVSLSTFEWIILVGLAASFFYQFKKVYPYSKLYPRKKNVFESEGCVSIFAANVLQTNTKYNAFIAEVKKYNPDIVLAMETNIAWENGISEIEKTHPYNIKVPQENFYGMHLYSKFELKNVEQLFLVESDVPSIYCNIAISNKIIKLICLHPAPPSPTENETSKQRDAELISAAKKVKKTDTPVVICGDMNDVVWSRVTRLLKK